MMLNYPSIPTKLPAAPSRNYPQLREETIAELQALSGTIWTDYNLHDPGVTLLEAILYAITDLGYQTDNDIATLLASHPDGPLALEAHFHRAKYILTNCAYTPTDYRRYFLDIPGIQQVLLQRCPIKCPLLFCRTEERKAVGSSCNNNFTSLAFNREDTVNNWYITDWEKVQLNGLYCLPLQLENKVSLDIPYDTFSFNPADGVGTGSIQVQGQLVGIIVYLPAWYQLQAGVWDNPKVPVKEVTLVQALTPVGNNRFSTMASIKLGRRRTAQVVPLEIEVQPARAGAIRPAIPRRSSARGNIFPASTTPLLQTKHILNAVHALLGNSQQGIFPQWQRRLLSASQVIADLKVKYCAKRNLCEDVENITLCRPQDVVLKGAIDLESGVDPEEVIAQMFCAIEDYLAPVPHFYTLAELQAEEMATEEIFEGPLLKHGFLKEDEIKGMQSRTAVHHSDLIGIMACTAGVTAVRNLLTCSFIGTKEVIHNEQQCFLLEDSSCFHFRLDVERSLENGAICCFQSGSLVVLDVAEIKGRYAKMKASRLKREVQDDCLTLPEATPIDNQYWHSVQYDLPRVYGVGRDGLGPSATALQHGRAKQTKAFLFFFEQLMANFLSQLSHVGSLFSMSATETQTYFYQTLYHLPKVGPIFQSHLQSGQDWNTFIADVQNDYVQALDKGAEGALHFLQRRNNFLDHLLARFGENVEHYESWVRHYYRHDPAFVESELIRVKQNLLVNYPALSSPRATALNYCKKRKDGTPDVWDTDNVSGYLKRVCAKVGLYNCRRRSLCADAAYPNVFEIFDETDNDGITEWWFRLRDELGNILMTASDRYTSYPQLLAALQTVTNLAMYRDNFEIRVSVAGKHYFLLRDGTDTLARRIPGFQTEEEAEATIQKIINKLWLELNGEGAHVVEHILLRPQNNNYTLLRPFLCGDEPRRKPRIIKDPYSFVMTIVLPSGYERDFTDSSSLPVPTACSPRLRDPGYRQVVEQVLREEAPAHIYFNIYWLDTDTSATLGDHLSLNRFEQLYKDWLEHLTASESALKPHNDKLVKFLNDLLPVLQRPA